jgi:hypothetical protein
MKRLTAVVGAAAFVLSACGGAAPSAATTSSAPATAPPATTPAPAGSPSGETVTIKVTFDSQSCSVAGPAVVEDGTTIVWVFENTPAAIEASTEKGAKSIGSDLVVIAVAEGTTWEAFLADSPPEGTKGDWPPAPAYMLLDSVDIGYGPSATISTVANGYAYVVMCNVYWNFDPATPFAMYKGALVQVLKG